MNPPQRIIDPVAVEIMRATNSNVRSGFIVFMYT